MSDIKNKTNQPLPPVSVTEIDNASLDEIVGPSNKKLDDTNLKINDTIDEMETSLEENTSFSKVKDPDQSSIDVDSDQNKSTGSKKKKDKKQITPLSPEVCTNLVKPKLVLHPPNKSLPDSLNPLFDSEGLHKMADSMRNIKFDQGTVEGNVIASLMSNSGRTKPTSSEEVDKIIQERLNDVNDGHSTDDQDDSDRHDDFGLSQSQQYLQDPNFVDLGDGDLEFLNESLFTGDADKLQELADGINDQDSDLISGNDEDSSDDESNKNHPKAEDKMLEPPVTLNNSDLNYIKSQLVRFESERAKDHIMIMNLLEQNKKQNEIIIELMKNIKAQTVHSSDYVSHMRTLATEASVKALRVEVADLKLHVDQYNSNCVKYESETKEYLNVIALHIKDDLSNKVSNKILDPKDQFALPVSSKPQPNYSKLVEKYKYVTDPKGVYEKLATRLYMLPESVIYNMVTQNYEDVITEMEAFMLSNQKMLYGLRDPKTTYLDKIKLLIQIMDEADIVAQKAEKLINKNKLVFTESASKTIETHEPIPSTSGYKKQKFNQSAYPKVSTFNEFKQQITESGCDIGEVTNLYYSSNKKTLKNAWLDNEVTIENLLTLVGN